jgi:myo-inositol-1(or 4)-monophosphatase
MEKDLQIATEIVKQVNKKLKAHFSRDGIEAHSYKDHSQILTEVDLEINDFIVDELQKTFPNDKIVSEEADDVAGDEARVWYVDPLDGTQNFADGIPIFGTAIGLVKDKLPYLGVIGLPYLDEIYTGVVEGQAICNGKKISIRIENEGKPTLTFAAAYPEGKRRFKQIICQIDTTQYNMRNYGCAVFDLLVVARGQAEGCIMTNLHQWDYTAAAAIIIAAGGKVTNWKGGEWTTDDETVVASNGLLHDEIVKITRNVT